MAVGEKIWLLEEKNNIVATFKKCSENVSKKVQNSKIFLPSGRGHPFHKNPIPYNRLCPYLNPNVIFVLTKNKIIMYLVI